MPWVWLYREWLGLAVDLVIGFKGLWAPLEGASELSLRSFQGLNTIIVKINYKI